MTVAVEHQQGRHARRRRAVKGAQLQPVISREHDLVEAGLGRDQTGLPAITRIDEVALPEIERGQHGYI